MENTPRNFALQLGALVTLYATLTALITLLFNAVNLALPDPAEAYWQIESASESIRFAFAALIIVFPAYLVLTRSVNVIRRRDAHGSYLGLTRWLIYLSLLIGGAILLGDAVAVVYGFLNGELTLRFFLKAAILAAVIKMAFGYYLLDARGYWQTHERYSQYCGLVAIAIVLASLVWGYAQMESPSEVRERRLDEQQVTDLQDMQSRIANYLYTNQALPETIAELYSVNEAPTAPENRTAYRYEITDDGFQLCATFAQPSRRHDYAFARPSAPAASEQPQIMNPNDWEHAAGAWCFSRSVQ